MNKEKLFLDIVIGDDGFAVFWPMSARGAFSAHTLREIADELDNRNKPWQEQLDADLATELSSQSSDS